MSDELVPMTIGWFDMPLEMREMIMEQMEVETKGKLLQCSKDCGEDIKGMKNFIRKIEVNWSSTTVYMKVFLENSQFMDMEMKKDNYNVQMKYNSSKFKIVTDSLVGNFIEIALNRIKSWIYNAVNLEVLEMKLNDFPLDRFDINHLKRLKEIKITSEENLDISLNNGFMNNTQFWNIENITLVNFKFTIEEFFNLRASSVALYKVDLSPANLNHFLKLWMRGKINENFNKMKVVMNDNKNKNELASIVLKDVNAIGQHEKYDCIWARLINENNEWAEIHVSNNSFVMICKTSADKFQYKGFDFFDKLNMEEDTPAIIDVFALREYLEADDYEELYDNE